MHIIITTKLDAIITADMIVFSICVDAFDFRWYFFWERYDTLAVSVNDGHLPFDELKCILTLSRMLSFNIWWKV